MTEWKECRWGDIASLEYGKALKGYQDQVSGYRVYGTNGPIGWNSDYLCDSAGIIIGRKGAYRGVHFSPEPFYVIDTAFYLKPKIEFDLRWAYYYLSMYDINSMDSGSAIPSTSREDFYNLRLTLPSISEQKRIASILGAFDDKIELNRQVNATLEGMAQALFKSWFVDFEPVRAKAEGRRTGLPSQLSKLFPSEFEDSKLGPIPKRWKVGKIEDMFEVIMGQSPPGSTYNEDGVGMSFFQGRADFAFRFPKYRVFCTEPKRCAKPNDVLVSVRAPVGDVNVALEDCIIGRGLAAVRHKENCTSFALYSMKNIKKAFDVFENQGTVFGSINHKDFKSIQVICAESSVIGAFETICREYDDKIKNTCEESQSLSTLRDTLLPRLISGELQI